MSDQTYVSRSAVVLGEAIPDADAMPHSAVSWSAVLAGAAVAAALSVALFALGAGLGLASVSPWAASGVSMTTFGILTGAWFLAVQLFAPGVGGYLAGRLRTTWTSVHTDEVYFRDTAHGFLVWAVSAVVTVALLGAASLSAASVASRGAGASVEIAGASERTTYFADMLFRADHPIAAADIPGLQASEAETSRIMAVDAVSGDAPAADRSYVAQLVAARTGLSQADAEKRVSDVIDQAKAAADHARKTGVSVALWAFISLLVGAFSASYMATVGGRLRDNLPMTG